MDFPHPDGPISAWTRWAWNPSDTLFTAVNFPYIAVSLSVSTRIVTGAAVGGRRAGRRRAQGGVSHC